MLSGLAVVERTRANLPLTLKYRPRRFEEVTGQRHVRLVLSRMLHNEDIRPAMLFYGSKGTGKTTMARLFVAALNCEKEDPTSRPCGSCSTCEQIALGQSSDVTEVDAASSGLVEDVRELRQSLQFAPQSRYRCLVLDEAHELTQRGFQTLLKTLEEPPPNTVFILATTERTRIPDTILSRCLSLEFRRLTTVQLAARLRQIADGEGLEVSDELLAAIAARADGAARDAVGLLDQARLVCVRTPEQLAALLGEVDHGAAILAALAPDRTGWVDYDAAFAAVSDALYAAPRPAAVVASLVAALRRLVAAQGARTPLEAGLASVAEVVPPDRAVAGMRAVWDFHVRIASALDSDAALDLLIVRLGEALAGAARPGDSARRS